MFASQQMLLQTSIKFSTGFLLQSTLTIVSVPIHIHATGQGGSKSSQVCEGRVGGEIVARNHLRVKKNLTHEAYIPYYMAYNLVMQMMLRSSFVAFLTIFFSIKYVFL